MALSIPARWAKRSDRDALIVLSDDRDLMMVLLVIDTVDVPRAMEGLVVHLQRYVTEPALSDPRADELNGMRALYVGGTGSLNGNPVTLGVIVTFTPRDKALVVFGIASESTSDDTHQQAETMLASIHPL